MLATVTCRTSEIVGHRSFALVLLEGSRTSLGLSLSGSIVIVLESWYIPVAFVARYDIRLGQYKVWIQPLHSLSLLLPLALLLLLASEVNASIDARQACLMVKIHLGAWIGSSV